MLCELSHFSRLAALRSLQLRKQAAYFPEHRAFRASSLSVPITPGAMAGGAPRTQHTHGTAPSSFAPAWHLTRGT